MQFLPARRLVGFIFFGFFLSISFFSLARAAFAQTPTPTQSPGTWVEDNEVTSVGKTAVRAKQFLDWTLGADNANWVFLAPPPIGGVNTVGGVNRLGEFWSLIRNIAYVLTVAVVLFTSFLIIISRGKSVNARKQILIIGVVLLLITLSFDIIRNLYLLIDTIQNFFLRLPHNGSQFINSDDLLSVSFNYDTFIGYRKIGASNEEAANVAISLVKTTSVTYYVMAGILLLRKIILWFFIILSPLWVLLLPFPLIRNTAKIWMGEFFRWLFYAPLFAILLAGVVKVWQSNIPLNFETHNPRGDYPVAISILLGGPNVDVGLSNSVNNIDRYAMYIIALLMLWLVIILPFILLKIFRDAIAAVFKEDNVFLQKAFSSLYPFLGRVAPGPAPPGGAGGGRGGGGSPVPPGPGSPGAGGLTQELTFRKPIQAPKEITINAQTVNLEGLPQSRTSDIVKYAGLSVPTMQEIARMDMQRSKLSQSQSLLRNIATPTTVSNAFERSRFSSIQQELLSRSRRGDSTAATILTAAQIARTGKPVALPLTSYQISQTKETTRSDQAASVYQGSRIDRSKVTETQRPAQGQPTAVVVGGTRTGNLARAEAPLTAAKPKLLPVVNRVQTVGIDDYEDVKRMWEENYRTGEVPLSDKVKSREEWLAQDIAKLESVIELLSSTLEEQKKKGIEELAFILPFLLLGGFSEQETVIYLKAKIEAAKKVFKELDQKVKEEEEVLIENKKETQGEKTMEAEKEIEKPNDSKSEAPNTKSEPDIVK